MNDASVGGLCERCKREGRIVACAEVHHKVRLTPATVRDPNVALCWDNLEALCLECHKQEHKRKQEKRWTCDERGRVL